MKLSGGQREAGQTRTVKRKAPKPLAPKLMKSDHKDELYEAKRLKLNDAKKVSQVEVDKMIQTDWSDDCRSEEGGIKEICTSVVAQSIPSAHKSSKGPRSTNNLQEEVPIPPSKGNIKIKHIPDLKSSKNYQVKNKTVQSIRTPNDCNQSQKKHELIHKKERALEESKRLLENCKQELEDLKSRLVKTQEKVEEYEILLNETFKDRDAIKLLLTKSLQDNRKERRSHEDTSRMLKEAKSNCVRIIGQFRKENQRQADEIAQQQIKCEKLELENSSLLTEIQGMKDKIKRLTIHLERSKYYDAEGNLIAQNPKSPVVKKGTSHTAQLRNKRKKKLRAHQKARTAIQNAEEEKLPDKNKSKRKRYYPQQLCNVCREGLPIFCLATCGHVFCGACIAVMAEMPDIDAVETVTCKCNVSSGKPIHLRAYQENS